MTCGTAGLESAPGARDPRLVFDDLALAYAAAPGVTFGRVWHSQGLRVHGKIFAMLVRDRLVVKLPAAHAADLQARGQASPFEPSPGRRMREWVVVDLPADADDWRQLIAAAHRHVAAIAAG